MCREERQDTGSWTRMWDKRWSQEASQLRVLCGQPVPLSVPSLSSVGDCVVVEVILGCVKALLPRAVVVRRGRSQAGEGRRWGGPQLRKDFGQLTFHTLLMLKTQAHWRHSWMEVTWSFWGKTLGKSWLHCRWDCGRI